LGPFWSGPFWFAWAVFDLHWGRFGDGPFWSVPMIISLVLDVLICMLLLAVQVSTEVKYDDTLLAEPVDGISLDSVVSSTNLCSSQAALRSLVRTINDRGPSRDPYGIPPQSVFQEENS